MVNVFSFCLYGSPSQLNDKFEHDDCEGGIKPGGYYDGLLENIRLIQRHYPEWKVFVYTGKDVTESFINMLGTFPSVTVFPTGVLGHQNSIYRAFAIDEPGVDVMIVRDTDSRVHWKDRWAIDMFMKQTSYGVQVIRDHKGHGVRIPAGLWGMKKGVLKTKIRDLYAAWKPVNAGCGNPNDVMGFGIDQNFLGLEIYPAIRHHTVVFHSFTDMLMIGEAGVFFPFDWSNDMYCGRIEAKPQSEPFSARELESAPPPNGPLQVTSRLLESQLTPKKIYGFIRR
jgi:hypothetical protein